MFHNVLQKHIPSIITCIMTCIHLLHRSQNDWKISAGDPELSCILNLLQVFHFLQFIALCLSNFLIEKFTTNLLQVFPRQEIPH
jgi:hypothetical protein